MRDSPQPRAGTEAPSGVEVDGQARGGGWHAGGPDGLGEPAAVAFSPEALAWSARERLSARLLAAGPAAVTDDELLHLLCCFATAAEGQAEAPARALLERFGGLGAALAADPLRLREVAGVTTPVIALLKAVQTAVTRLLHEQVRERPVIGSWTALLDYLQVALANEQTEQFRILFLDRRNALIKEEVQQRGTVDHTPLYPREVVKRCLELAASAIIMVHNHPSGDPTPSKADVEMTQRVVAALAVLEITVHDHVVVGRGRTASLRALDLL
ncbi:MAG TPA: DNA repair protein RadC [Geminicoccaceae bacterium]|nr:DNA repair protein RadC [Geminicoccaceae bacterium]